MNVRIVTPEGTGRLGGNRVTAARWSRILRDLGHRVQIGRRYEGEACDALVALHARKSVASIRRFARVRPDAPLIVAMTGTDLYGDVGRSASAMTSLHLATHLVVLQPEGRRRIPAKLRKKVRVILQSAEGPRRPVPKRKRTFDVVVVGHLRPVKDPFLTARASRTLPRSSRIRVLQIGSALTPAMERRARAEEKRNPRFVWIGERSRGETLRHIARSRLLVNSSKMEGGANVISEALVASVPVLASRIPGSIGMLGRSYPGLFAPGSENALRKLLVRAETDASFLAEISSRCTELSKQFTYAREKARWRELLSEHP